MILLSFHPKGRESANADRSVEGTEKKEKKSAFYLHPVACRSFNTQVSMHKCSVRRKTVGPPKIWPLILHRNKPNKLRSKLVEAQSRVK